MTIQSKTREAVLDRVARLTRAGATIPAIAAELGCSERQAARYRAACHDRDVRVKGGRRAK